MEENDSFCLRKRIHQNSHIIIIDWRYNNFHTKNKKSLWFRIRVKVECSAPNPSSIPSSTINLTSLSPVDIVGIHTRGGRTICILGTETLECTGKFSAEFSWKDKKCRKHLLLVVILFNFNIYICLLHISVLFCFWMSFMRKKCH